MPIVSHYPWFLVHNWLDSNLPIPATNIENILKSALIGFVASLVSDTISNILKVIKTVKQSASSESLDELLDPKYGKGRRMSYTDVVRQVVDEGGLTALFGRGLSTRLLSNAVQSVLFTVVWKLMTTPAH